MKKPFILAVLFSAIGLASPAQNTGKADASKGGNFSVLQGKVDGHPVFATIDMGLRNFPDKARLPVFLSISTRLVSPTSEGLPTRQEAENLNTWEDAVEAKLKPQGKIEYIGRVTWNGKRELLYYVDHQEPFEKALHSLIGTHATRPFTFAFERDERWLKAQFWFNHR